MRGVKFENTELALHARSRRERDGVDSRPLLRGGRGGEARDFVEAAGGAAEGCGQGSGFAGESRGIQAVEGFICTGEDLGGISSVSAGGVDGVFVPCAA
jgi:hypothetical protein